MKIILLCLSLLTINEAAFAKTKKTKKKSAKTTRAAKLSKEDAKELCLINEGASISDEQLTNCINKTMKAGKFVK